MKTWWRGGRGSLACKNEDSQSFRPLGLVKELEWRVEALDGIIYRLMWALKCFVSTVCRFITPGICISSSILYQGRNSWQFNQTLLIALVRWLQSEPPDKVALEAIQRAEKWKKKNRRGSMYPSVSREPTLTTPSADTQSQKSILIVLSSLINGAIYMFRLTSNGTSSASIFSSSPLGHRTISGARSLRPSSVGASSSTIYPKKPCADWDFKVVQPYLNTWVWRRSRLKIPSYAWLSLRSDWWLVSYQQKKKKRGVGIGGVQIHKNRARKSRAEDPPTTSTEMAFMLINTDSDIWTGLTSMKNCIGVNFEGLYATRHFQSNEWVSQSPLI